MRASPPSVFLSEIFEWDKKRNKSRGLIQKDTQARRTWARACVQTYESQSSVAVVEGRLWGGTAKGSEWKQTDCPLICNETRLSGDRVSSQTHPPVFVPAPRAASRQQGVRTSPHFDVLLGSTFIGGLRSWLPGREVFRQRGLAAPQVDGCHHPVWPSEATLPESTNEGLVRACTTIPVRLR